jgi:hypothetical protein
VLNIGISFNAKFHAQNESSNHHFKVLTWIFEGQSYNLKVNFKSVKSLKCKSNFKQLRILFNTFIGSLIVSLLNFRLLILTQGQEVEFHEIKINFFMRSKFNVFMRLNLFINIWQCWSGGGHFDHEVEISKYCF